MNVKPNVGDRVSIIEPGIPGTYRLERNHGVFDVVEIDGSLIGERYDSHGFRLAFDLSSAGLVVRVVETADERATFRALAARAQRVGASAADRAVFDDFLRSRGQLA